jgi:hypothetical protein
MARVLRLSSYPASYGFTVFREVFRFSCVVFRVIGRRGPRGYQLALSSLHYGPRLSPFREQGFRLSMARFVG